MDDEYSYEGDISDEFFAINRAHPEWGVCLFQHRKNSGVIGYGWYYYVVACEGCGDTVLDRVSEVGEFDSRQDEAEYDLRVGNALVKLESWHDDWFFSGDHSEALWQLELYLIDNEAMMA